jgi:peptidoglycan DL-endopeptidase CwlO
MAFSAAAAATIATLFNPLPAAAAPGAPGAPIPAVPDVGSRPIPLGSLVMPGQTTPAAAPSATPSIPTSPVLAKIEKQRAEIAALGDRLIRLGQDRDLAKQQQAVADTKLAGARAALAAAQQEAATAAGNSLRDAAALPPGALGSGLQDLDQLAQMQRGSTATEESAARQLAIAQAALTAAQAEQATAAQQAIDLSSQYDKLNTDIAFKQAALQKVELQHADEISAAEAAESAADRRLGAEYLAGAQQGRGADKRAIAALQYALDQRGDLYEWSKEGPDTFDCSGLMWAAYHQPAAGNFPLPRVSRDQYWYTRNKVVDRYSLLPGDLLFFSTTNSWLGIHHVAMYAGNGMMVEAPRTGLTVRLTPVRWTRLFQATRVYGSVDGPTQGPDLNAPPPPSNGSHPTTPTTRPSSRPPTTTPTKPSTPPTSTSPSTPPTSTSPSTPPTSTSPSPSDTSTTTPPASESASSSPSSGSTSSGSTSSSSTQSSPSGSLTSSASAPSAPASSSTSSASSSTSSASSSTESASASSSASSSSN